MDPLNDRSYRVRVNKRLREKGLPAWACRACRTVKALSAFSLNAVGDPMPDCRPCRAEREHVRKHGADERRRTLADLSGRRVGTLTVRVRVAGGSWVCDCACGQAVVKRTGDLNRGMQTCGDTRAHLADDIGYSGAHSRVRAIRGPARGRCCGCGSQAAHWAYSGCCPKELSADQGSYSSDPYQYDAMCVPCHKRKDLARIAAQQAA